MKENKMSIIIDALPINESFARSVVASFCLQTEPTLEEIGDIKTAVSEAVTNSIVHGYKGQSGGKIKINVSIKDERVLIEIIDNGIGIADIQKAREPFFTTAPGEERSGMGFTVMESFMDKVEVLDNKKGGVIVRFIKNIKGECLSKEVSVHAFKAANI